MAYQTDSQLIQQAYDEDFSQSMFAGKEPALLQYTRSSVQQAQADYDRVTSFMGQGRQSSTAPHQEPDREAEASFQRKKEQEETGNQPGFFTRTSSKITKPFKKATGFVYTQRKNRLQGKVEKEHSFIDLHQDRMNHDQEKLQNLVEQQRDKEAQRQEFINRIKDRVRQAKENVQKTFEDLGKNVRDAKEKGFGLPKFVQYVRQGVKDEYETYRSRGQDIVDRGADTFQSFRQRVREGFEERDSEPQPTEENPEDSIIENMAQRLKEKHQERDHFNQTMQDVHGRKIGYESLSVNEQVDPEGADRMAYMETSDFTIPTKNGGVSFVRNSAYYRYMMDMKAESALAESNGQMDSHDYKDRAKELYEYLSEERGESETTEVFHEKMRESFDRPSPSKRLSLYLAKNPPLTKPEDGLTKNEFEKEVDPDNYNTSSSPDGDSGHENQTEADHRKTSELRQESSINKEFNGADMDHGGYIDLDQDVPIAAYAYGPQSANSAFGSYEADTEALIQLVELENNYSKQAIMNHKQPEPIMNMDGPSVPSV